MCGSSTRCIVLGRCRPMYLFMYYLGLFFLRGRVSIGRLCVLLCDASTVFLFWVVIGLCVFCYATLGCV